MKVTDVRAAQPPASNAPRDWRGTLGQLSVAVEADGLLGYGMGAGGPRGRTGSPLQPEPAVELYQEDAVAVVGAELDEAGGTAS